MGHPQKYGGMGVRSTKKPAISPKWCKTGQGYYDALIGSRILSFKWYQNQLPWMTVNGQNVSLAEIKSFKEPNRKISTKIDPFYQWQNVG